MEVSIETSMTKGQIIWKDFWYSGPQTMWKFVLASFWKAFIKFRLHGEKKYISDVYLLIFPCYNSQWDFLPKFISLHYCTPLEGVLGVQRSRQAQGTLFVWSAVFQPKMKWHSKTYKNYQNPVKSCCFFRIFSVFVQFWLENSNQNQLDELK